MIGVLLAGTVAGSLSPAQAQTAARKPARVAIFFEKEFPTYGVSSVVSPQQIANDLRTAGINVDLLDADALSQPSRFSVERYGAVILLYGNTYPQEAFENLRQFHRAGGSLVTTGIPFTHAAARIGARDWSANPNWGTSVRHVAGAGSQPGEDAIRVISDGEGWKGVTSARFAVHPGDKVQATAMVRDMTPRSPTTTGNQQDNLFVRFFDASGNFIRQEGARLELTDTSWHNTSVNVTAPADAAFADLSLQAQRRGHTYLATEFQASINGQSVTLPNADLKQRTNIFSDLGHNPNTALWGSNGIGIGGFDGPAPNKPAPALLPPGDPFHLKGVFKPTTDPHPSPQWLDTTSLPSGVQSIVAVGEAKRPLATLVVHKTDAFAGAVDAWTCRGFDMEWKDYESRQVITRATIAVLAKRGQLSAQQNTLALNRLNSLPRPIQYSNLTLPRAARRYTTFQPKMPAPARHLYVADVRSLQPDERLLLITLQGIVNRKQPRIYFVFDKDDSFWLKELQKQKATDAPIPVTDPFSLLKTFRKEFKGAVVCDPKVYSSPCVAVSLAGADDVVVARTAELAARLHLPIKIDLRGKFKDNAAALRYLRTSVQPRLNPYLTCSLDPLRYDKGGLDQIVAARGSAFWITGPKASDLPGANQMAEIAEVRAMLAHLPLGAVVRGFWWDGDGMGMDEEAGVAMGSRFGKVTLVSDLITNLSVHSGVPAQKLKQRPRPTAPKLDQSKVYLSFTMSDGDNLCTWRGYFLHYFQDPVRGTVPVGWGMGPSIIDLAPTWARWYYAAATPNDEFICDVSGVAYIYPPDWGMNLKDRTQAMHWFYDLTQTYMDRMDMKTIRLMNVDAPSIARVGELLPKVPFLMPDYGDAGGHSYAERTYTLSTGQPVFRAFTSGSGPRNLADQIRTRAGKTRPAFVNAFIWNWGSNLSDLKKVMEELGPEYVAVLPSQLNELYRTAQKNKKY